MIALNLFRRFAVRLVATSLPALLFCAAAHSQTFSCPLSSSLAVSGFISPASTPCVIDSGVTLTLDSAATFTGTLSGILTNDGTISNAGNYDNTGTTLTNFGTVFNSGNLQGGTVTNAGIFDNFSTMQSIQNLNNISTLTNTGTLGIQGPGTLTNTAGANLNNTASLTIAEVTATNNGTITNFSAGNFENSSATLTNNGFLINNGQMSNTFDSSSLFNSGGLVATLTNNGTFTNNGGFGNEGNAPANAFNTVNNNGSILNYNTFISEGLFSNNSGATLTNETGGSLFLEQPSIQTIQTLFTNQAGATLINNGTLQNDVSMVNSGQLTNNGTLSNQLQGILTVGGVLTNVGTVQNNGVIHVASGGVLNNSGIYLNFLNTTVDGTFNSPLLGVGGGSVSGSGTINGDLDNSFGFVEPGDSFGGTLTVNGNYTQSAAGELDIVLAGAAPGQFAALDVAGLATLSGSLDFDSQAGFMPATGDDFTFLEFGSLSGSFSSIVFNFWQCPTGDTCTIVTGAHSMSLDIASATTGGGGGTTSTPEPSTLALLAAGFFALAIGIRSRAGGLRAGERD
jgi:PEP-CTERM motif